MKIQNRMLIIGCTSEDQLNSSNNVDLCILSPSLTRSLALARLLSRDEYSLACARSFNSLLRNSMMCTE